MVEAEGAVATDEPVITKQAAGRIADDDVGAGSRPGAGLRVEGLVVIPKPRARTGDRQTGACDLARTAVVKDDVGRARRQPRKRSGIDQVADRVVTVVAEPREHARGTGRADAGT